MCAAQRSDRNPKSWIEKDDYQEEYKQNDTFEINTYVMEEDFRGDSLNKKHV